jgi:hypothetical protein
LYTCSLSRSFSSSGPASVTGVVVDSAGRAVPRAAVQIIAADGSTVATAVTGADGTFRVADAPAACRVEASLTGSRTRPPRVTRRRCG